jgi:glycosyltransferase involved in cell wall biosynthesis
MDLTNLRINFFTTGLPPKGPTRQLSYLANELQRRAVRYCIRSIRNISVNDWRGLFTGDPSAVKSGLVAFLNVRHGEIVHSSGIAVDLIALIIARKSKWLCTVRNIPWQDYPPKFGPLLGWLLWRLHLLILNRCENVVFCSSHLQQEFLKYGISGTVIENSSISFSVETQPLSLELLYVGSLIQRKNIDRLAIFKRKSFFAKSTGYIYGKGPMSDCLAPEDGWILVGFENNLEIIYSKPRVFISLSGSEGMPNAALEAIANRCVLILSDIPPHRKLNNIFPEIVLLVDLTKTELGFSECDFRRMIDNYPAVNWHSVRNRYRNSFGQEAMASKYLEIYAKLSHAK